MTTLASALEPSDHSDTFSNLASAPLAVASSVAAVASHSDRIPIAYAEPCSANLRNAPQNPTITSANVRAQPRTTSAATTQRPQLTVKVNPKRPSLESVHKDIVDALRKAKAWQAGEWMPSWQGTGDQALNTACSLWVENLDRGIDKMWGGYRHEPTIKPGRIDFRQTIRELVGGDSGYPEIDTIPEEELIAVAQNKLEMHFPSTIGSGYPDSNYRYEHADNWIQQQRETLPDLQPQHFIAACSNYTTKGFESLTFKHRDHPFFEKQRYIGQLHKRVILCRLLKAAASATTQADLSPTPANKQLDEPEIVVPHSHSKNANPIEPTLKKLRQFNVSEALVRIFSRTHLAYTERRLSPDALTHYYNDLLDFVLPKKLNQQEVSAFMTLANRGIFNAGPSLHYRADVPALNGMVVMLKALETQMLERAPDLQDTIKHKVNEATARARRSPPLHHALAFYLLRSLSPTWRSDDNRPRLQ